MYLAPGGLKVHPVDVLVASVGKGMTGERMRVAQELWSAYVPRGRVVVADKLHTFCMLDAGERRVCVRGTCEPEGVGSVGV